MAEGSVQPSAATLPARASTAATTRSPWADAIASATSGSRTAAVPSTTRSTPARIASSTLPESRKPAAELDRDPHGRGDPAHVVEVPGLARPRAVEIDHVEPGRALPLPAHGGDHGVVLERGLAVVVALHQPDGAAVADVDCGVEDQAQMRVKFSSNARPAELDFSGWNWTPYSGGRSTAHAKRSP